MEYKQEANMEKTNITEIITKYFKAVCEPVVYEDTAR